jgi:hypothetical protein
MTIVRKPALQGEQVASELVPSSQIKGDDEQDTTLLRKMSEAASQYISTFPWCAAVHNSYFGGGVGGIFAVFFFHIRPSRPEVDPWIWIVVGDIPPAYIPLSDSESPADVFRSYMRGMTRWVEMARNGGVSAAKKGVPPVDLPATPEWAEKINQKLYGLTLAVKPFFEGDAEPLCSPQ